MVPPASDDNAGEPHQKGQLRKGLNMPKRLAVSLKPEIALEVTRVSIGAKKLVYVLVANRKLKYRWERSNIVYIGTTKRGVSRVASSAASKAESILGHYGVKTCSARIITCSPRRAVKSWLKLERALLLVFRELYGDIPKLNTLGAKIKEKDEFVYFKRSRIRQILRDISG